MIEEHSSAVLTEPLPAAGLVAGDVGVVVHVHRNGQAFEVEFMTLEGNTLTVEMLTAKQIRAALIAGGFPARITSTFSCANSAARPGSRSALPSAKRHSITRFLPST